MQYVTGMAQRVNAARVVFAFARDNTLHASRLAVVEEDASVHPVNAVWFVIGCSAVIGLLGFSETALSSLAG